MATSKKAAPAGPATRGLSVTSRPASFWRIGRQFTGEATVIPLSELTDEQVKELKDEPLLAVVEVDVQRPADEAAKT